jgi:hypothetical protein
VVAGAIVAIGSSNPSTPAGCLRVDLPSTMGGTPQLCGNTAASFCASNAAPPVRSTRQPCRSAERPGANQLGSTGLCSLASNCRAWQGPISNCWSGWARCRPSTRRRCTSDSGLGWRDSSASRRQALRGRSVAQGTLMQATIHWSPPPTTGRSRSAFGNRREAWLGASWEGLQRQADDGGRASCASGSAVGR